MDNSMLTDEQLIKIERLNAFGRNLAEKRKLAVDARKNSGFEETCREDEEFREGIDDANRDKVNSVALKNRYERANGHNLGGSPNKHHGSTVFLNITAPYIANAVASLSDMLMPTDDQPFRVDPTPIPFLNDDAQSDAQMTGPDGQQYSVADMAKQLLAEAKGKAAKAQLQIEDYLTESKFNPEVRKVIDDVVAVGVGILKGPYPVKRKARKVEHIDGVTKITIVEETRPASKRISYWNFYPDPACGDNIHNGAFVWEKDTITARQLMALKGMQDSEGNSYYIDYQIDKILKEGPLKKHELNDTKPALTDKFDIWYYYGTATKEDLDAADCQCENENMAVDVLVIMINDRVIKASLHTLDSGEFPYDVMVYQPLSDTWVGKGLARQIREPQRIINAAIRNLLDNAGIGGSPILVLANGVESDDGQAIEFKRGLVLRVTPDATINDARQAVQAITIPIITNDLIATLQLAQKMAEDVTGMPMLLQGQQGAATDTVGGMQMLEANSSATRRNIAKLFDDKMIVPHITRYYEWMMIHGDDDEAKGDFQINARGSTVLFERDAARQALLQMGPMLANPAFGIDPRKYLSEVCKASRVDKDSISFTDEEIKQQQEQAQQQPEDPAMAIAKLKGDYDMQLEQLKQQGLEKETSIRINLNEQDLAFKTQQADLDRQHELQVTQLNHQIEIMKLSAATQQSVNKIKADLAMTTNKLSVQKQLSNQGAQTMKPPTEPEGRAENGRAFEQ